MELGPTIDTKMLVFGGLDRTNDGAGVAKACGGQFSDVVCYDGATALKDVWEMDPGHVTTMTATYTVDATASGIRGPTQLPEGKIVNIPLDIDPSQQQFSSSDGQCVTEMMVEVTVTHPCGRELEMKVGIFCR